MVLADVELELAGPGNRVRFTVPDSVAGDMTLSLRRLSGWAAQAVKLRAVLLGGAEVALQSAVSVNAPATPVESTRTVVKNTVFASGDVLSVGIDTPEAGRVLVRVTLIVAGGHGCSCGTT